MRAAYYKAFGGVAYITIGELEFPEVKEGEVLVRIKAAAVRSRRDNGSHAAD